MAFSGWRRSVFRWQGICTPNNMYNLSRTENCGTEPRILPWGARDIRRNRSHPPDRCFRHSKQPQKLQQTSLQIPAAQTPEKRPFFGASVALICLSRFSSSAPVVAGYLPRWKYQRGHRLPHKEGPAAKTRGLVRPRVSLCSY